MWQDELKGNALDWLLGESEPGVRYLALRDLLEMPKGDPQLLQASQQAHIAGPIALILDNMHPQGYWEKPGSGYTPKYRSTVWSLILLAQLGADIEVDGRIQTAIDYYFQNAYNPHGQIGLSGAPSSTADCLQGNMCYALQSLGCQDERLDKAYEWMARSVTGEGIAPMTDKQAELRFYAGKCGPLFACGANDKKSCAWGAVKVMLAFGVYPKAKRTPLIERAIQQGIEFLLAIEPTTAEWPHPYYAKPSGNWWKFGFPVFYITDLLQMVEAMALLGYGKDPRLSQTVQLVKDKQDEKSRWLMELDYRGKTWGEYGVKKEPNKWVTLRALRALKGVGL